MNARWTKHVLPEGPIKYLTVDKKSLAANQLLHRQHFGAETGNELMPCWIQVGDDKQNKINCWHVVWDGRSEFEYGEPALCGAQMYLKTTAELEYWV